MLSAAAPAHAAATDGQLKQLPLPDGCIAKGAPGGCNGAITPNLSNIGEPAMSSDGLHLYVPDRGADALVVFDRNPATGVLTQKKCFTFVALAGCTTTAYSPLEDATGVAVTPDGKDLLVVGGSAGGSAPDGIINFSLGADGTPSFEGCVNSNGTGGCASSPGFASSNPATVAVSPDGTSVYVATYDNSGIVIFDRTASGQINQAQLTTTAQKCINRGGTEGCTQNTLLANPRDIEVTPDGNQVITANAGCLDFTSCFNLVALDRNSTTGALSPHPGNAGCITSPFGKPGCTTRDTFSYGPSQMAITPDGRHIYTTSRWTSPVVNAIFVTDRDPATGNLSFRPHTCTKSPGGLPDCPVEAASLNDPFDVALSPNGRDLYASGFGGQRIGVFERAGNDTAVPKPAPFGCLAVATDCGNVLNQGTNVEYVISSPDGKNVYGMGIGRIFSFAVDHAPSCRDMPVSTAFNTAVTIKLDCSDADGDPLQFHIMSAPAKGQLGALQGDGTITYGPLVGTSGTDSFTFSTTAGGVTTDASTVTVNVAAPAGGGIFAAGLDADHDGFFAGQDCNDNNPNIRPGAKEIPGNNIDENCDGIAQPFPTLTTPVGTKWSVKGKHFKLTQLTISSLPKHWTAQIRCTGGHCPFKKKALKGKAKKGVANVLGSLKKSQRRFRAKQTIEVWVSAPKFNTKVARLVLKAGKIPSTQALCVLPGAVKPQKRCG